MDGRYKPSQKNWYPRVGWREKPFFFSLATSRRRGQILRVKSLPLRLSLFLKHNFARKITRRSDQTDKPNPIQCRHPSLSRFVLSYHFFILCWMPDNEVDREEKIWKDVGLRRPENDHRLPCPNLGGTRSQSILNRKVRSKFQTPLWLLLYAAVAASQNLLQNNSAADREFPPIRLAICTIGAWIKKYKLS